MADTLKFIIKSLITTFFSLISIIKYEPNCGAEVDGIITYSDLKPFGTLNACFELKFKPKLLLRPWQY